MDLWALIEISILVSFFSFLTDSIKGSSSLKMLHLFWFFIDSYAKG
jgi:hypothetical protein